MARKIIIAGGTGFLGSSLIKYFEKIPDFEIVVLTRHPSRAGGSISYVHWDGKNLGPWTATLENSEAVINLAGKSVNCRYTEKNKREIIASRVNATAVIGEAIQQARHPPKVWINAGSAAIFGDGAETILTENSLPGEGFSSQVCKEWETTFRNFPTAFTRKVFLRIGLVFQKNTGLLRPFVNLAIYGFGGTIGSGKQYISWIHEEDFANVVYAAVVNNDYKDVIHCSSPEPVTNRNFMRELRKVLHRPYGIPNPSIVVWLGALILGTESHLVLTGRRVVSKILVEKKFEFKYPGIGNALRNLLDKKQDLKQGS